MITPDTLERVLAAANAAHDGGAHTIDLTLHIHGTPDDVYASVDVREERIGSDTFVKRERLDEDGFNRILWFRHDARDGDDREPTDDEIYNRGPAAPDLDGYELGDPKRMALEQGVR